MRFPFGVPCVDISSDENIPGHTCLAAFPEKSYEQSRKHQRQEEEKEEEDCPQSRKDLKEPDYPNSILAVGERGSA